MRSLIFETALLIFMASITLFLDPQASQWLAYYHTGINQFELWRLISASFCHTNFNHLLMNVFGLIVTLVLFIDSFKIIKIFPLIMFNSLFVGVMLFFFEAQVIWYVGLSGVLHGLFSYGVCTDLKNNDRWGYILGSGLIIKIAYEQLFGAAQSTIDLINAPVLVNAHFYGALAGVVFYLLKRVLKNRKR